MFEASGWSVRCTRWPLRDMNFRGSLDPVQEPWSPHMQPAETACKLPASRFYNLRHSFAVNLLSATPPVDFKWVSIWLGHNTFSLTLDVYGDYINEDVNQPAGLARPIAAPADTGNAVPIDRRAN